MTPDFRYEFMERALAGAAMGNFTTHPNPRVGCVIVKNGSIVGEGFHACAGEAHAEVLALRMAGEDARGADVFVTLEPCCHHGRTPPCTDALIQAGVRAVWYAMRDPNPQVAGHGAARLREAGINVHEGPLSDKALALNRGFVSRMTRGRPFVTLKLAASMDGRTAMASGESQWITGEAARADVHRLRAEAGAVFTSSATVLADDPALTVRHIETPRQPDRIIFDPHGRVSVSAKAWAANGARRIAITPVQTELPGGVERCSVPARADGYPVFADVFAALGALQINEVLVECGPRMTGLLLSAQLVDEVVLYLAPCFMGHDARPLAQLPGLSRLADRLRFEWRDVARVGDDVRLIAAPALKA